MQDFSRANTIDAELADPYFGLGFVYYDLAIFDLLKRAKYRIHEKGKIVFEDDSPLPKRYPPSLEIFPDNRVNSVLLESLSSFQEGKRLKQIFDQKKSFIMFHPDEIDRTITSIRVLLRYQPGQVNTPPPKERWLLELND